MTMTTTLRATVAAVLTAAAVTLTAPTAEARPLTGYGQGTDVKISPANACRRIHKAPSWCQKYWYYYGHPNPWAPRR